MYKNQEYFEYLDDLRDSGLTNMYRAVGFLMGKYGIDKNESRVILRDWMQTFEERHEVEK